MPDDVKLKDPVERELSPELREPSDESKQVQAEIVRAARSLSEAGMQLKEIAEVIKKRSEDDVKRAAEKDRIIDSGIPQRLSDAEDLNDVLLSVPENDWERRLHKLNDEMMDVHLIRMAAAKHENNPIPYKGLQSLRAFDKFKKHVSLAAGGWWYPTPTGNQGGEWIPTGYSMSMINYYRLASRVWGSLPLAVLRLGEGSERFPVQTSRSAWVILNPVTSPQLTRDSSTVSNPGTDYITIAPVRHQGQTGFDAIMQEDMLISAMQMHREELVRSGRETLDTAAMDGQTLGAAMDLGNGPVPANGYGPGLRAWAFSGTYVNKLDLLGANIDPEDTVAARKQMGKFGVYGSELGVYLDPVNYMNLLISGKLETMDKLGPNATIVTGQVASLYDAPLFVYGDMLTNLATGGGAGTPSNLTCALVVNRTRWRAGMKRDIQISIAYQNAHDAWRLYATMRSGVGGAPGNVAADGKHVCLIHNVKST